MNFPPTLIRHNIVPLLLKVTQWKNFEEKYVLTLSFTPQEAIDYYTKLYASRQSNINHFDPTFNFKVFYNRGIMGPYERFSKS